jgi:hypothetical protein
MTLADVSALAGPAVQVMMTVALVLVGIICLRLDARLQALRAGRDGVAATAAELAAAVTRAEAAVKALKAATDSASSDLERQVAEARSAGEALKFLTTTARALEPAARSGVAPRTVDPIPSTARAPVPDRDGWLYEEDRPRPDPELVARQRGRWSGLR